MEEVITVMTDDGCQQQRPVAFTGMLQNGDLVKAFDQQDADAGWTSGELVTQSGFVGLIRHDDGSPFQLPAVLPLTEHHIVCLERNRSDLKAQRRERLLGLSLNEEELVDADDHRHSLERLAEGIAEEKTGRRNRKQLRHLRAQLDAVADRIGLAERKRNYLIVRARLGKDFHPWLCTDDRDRETLEIFGEGERETRLLISALRKAHLAPRRPHPQAQEVILRKTYRHKDYVDVVARPNANGLWSISAAEPDCKKRDRSLRRARGNGDLQNMMEDISVAMKAVGIRTAF